MSLSLLSLLACSTSVTGEVRDPAGTPLAGVVLVAEGCRAMSGSDGRYTADCPASQYNFLVEHPGFLPTSLTVKIAGFGTTSAPLLTLTPIPSEFGFYTVSQREFAPVPPAKLVHSSTPEDDPTRQSYCIGQETPTKIKAKSRFLDVHGVDWRVFRVPEDGCFYKLSRVRGTGDDAIWTWEATEVQLKTEPVGEGRFWVDNSLEPGRYAIVEWLGTFVPEPGSSENYRGWVIEIEPS